MNIDLLLQIKERILQEPDNFGMHAWHGVRSDGAPCQTAACIGGWAQILGGIPSARPIATTGESGRRLLGLTYDQRDRLFFANQWPKEFNRAYHEAAGKGEIRMAAKIAAKRIDHFIATNGAE